MTENARRRKKFPGREKNFKKKFFKNNFQKKKLEFFFNPGKIFFPEVQIYLKSKHCVLKILALYAYIFMYCNISPIRS